MLTIGFIAFVLALLAIIGVFALMAKDNRRRGQSDSRVLPPGKSRELEASGGPFRPHLDPGSI